MNNSNIECLKLPHAVVSRLIKEALPAGVNVSKEVKIAIARSAAVFVLHVTNYASENAKDHKRKNIMGPDILAAIKTLECDELEQPITEALKLFKVQKTQRLEQRKRKQAAEADTTSAQLTPSKHSRRSTNAVSASVLEQGDALEGEANADEDEEGNEDENASTNVEDEMDTQRPFI